MCRLWRGGAGWLAGYHRTLLSVDPRGCKLRPPKSVERLTSVGQHLRPLPQPPTPPKMSWNSYIENLQASGSVKKAAICGHDGSQWAASEGFSVTPAEAKTLVGAFTDSSALTQSGMHVGGTRFIFLSGTDQVLRGKKGTAGVHVAKTGQAILIGYYEDPTSPGQCATQVENMADYLKGMNY